MQKLALACLLLLGTLTTNGTNSVAHAQKTKAKAEIKAATKAPTARLNVISDQIVDALWEQSDHFWHEGDYNRIVALVRVCVEADPGFTEAYASGAYLLWSMQDPKAADELLLYGIQKTPQNGALYAELGGHYTRTKRDTLAAPMLEKAIAFGDAPYTTYSSLGNCYKRMGKLEKSLATWEIATKKFPEMGAAFTNRNSVKKLIAERKVNPKGS
jgi:tetratricopeptide (TPR) repeat protein